MSTAELPRFSQASISREVDVHLKRCGAPNVRGGYPRHRPSPWLGPTGNTEGTNPLVATPGS